MKILTVLCSALLASCAFAQELGSAWLVRQRAHAVPVAFSPLGEVRNLFGTGVNVALTPVFGAWGDRPVLGGAALFRRRFADNADAVFGPALSIEPEGRWVPGLAFGVTVRL